MPYKVEARGNKYVVFNPSTGKIYGTHPDKKSADAQQKALYANADPSKEPV